MATVNLKDSYSALNEALIKLFDESGVKRNFTVPYIASQEMSEHINSVAEVASGRNGRVDQESYHVRPSDHWKGLGKR